MTAPAQHLCPMLAYFLKTGFHCVDQTSLKLREALRVLGLKTWTSMSSSFFLKSCLCIYMDMSTTACVLRSEVRPVEVRYRKFFLGPGG